ncbi:hypothetical protein SLEP1_g2429 [Rubroshorea leprosula]|uniref:Uncharacterized protein n=1 Tax=Rubroshorea leprosula TaxID=152421 RepID=A0AAV5HHL2_9ROSI|nr:hypothetical protein SLEP1_g2429 [Rubroshorea leprosula]
MKKHESIIKTAKLASSEPSWVLSEPSKGDPALLGSTEPSRSRSPRTQPSWVSPNPTRLGLPCWVPTRPSKLGSTRSNRLSSSQPSEVETQGKKERKRKKEGEEEGLGGTIAITDKFGIQLASAEVPRNLLQESLKKIGVLDHINQGITDTSNP